MNQIIIGSQALKVAGEKYISKAKRSWDMDIICTEEVFEDWKTKLAPETKESFEFGKNVKNITQIIRTHDQNYEFSIAKDGNTNEELLNLANEYPSELTNIVDGKAYASPDLVYALKMSHRYLKDSPHFMKTMIDIKNYRHVSGKKEISNTLKDWYKRREKETYWYKHPKLDVKKDEFFKKSEAYNIYDHDDIHEAVRHKEKPAYRYYMKDDAEVECSKEKFFQVPEIIRLYGGSEEAMVLAVERSMVPSGLWPAQKAFHFALMKTATSITSGWFREYVWENYFKIVDLYNKEGHDTYWEKFKTALAEGRVKPFDASKVY